MYVILCPQWSLKVECEFEVCVFAITMTLAISLTTDFKDNSKNMFLELVQSQDLNLEEAVWNDNNLF